MNITLLGGGGHAKVIIGMIRALGHNPMRMLDDNPLLWGSESMGVPITGPIESASSFVEPAIISIGSNKIRKLFDERYDLDWATLIHPFAFVDPSALILPGTVVFAGATVQPESKLGRHVVVNTNASVDHECSLENYCQIAPGANLGGNVRVGEGVMIGLGASIHQGAVIGDWATVGGGAFVKGTIPPTVTAVGVPARFK